MTEAGYNRINSVSLWWDFRERRNEAQEKYQKTGDLNYLHTAKQMQSLMDGCFKDIINDK